MDNFELILDKDNESQKISLNRKLNFSDNENEDPRVKVVTNLTRKFITWCNTGIPVKPNFQDGLRVQKLIEMARMSNQII